MKRQRFSCSAASSTGEELSTEGAFRTAARRPGWRRSIKLRCCRWDAHEWVVPIWCGHVSSILCTRLSTRGPTAPGAGSSRSGGWTTWWKSTSGSHDVALIPVIPSMALLVIHGLPDYVRLHGLDMRATCFERPALTLKGCTAAAAGLLFAAVAILAFQTFISAQKVADPKILKLLWVWPLYYVHQEFVSVRFQVSGISVLLTILLFHSSSSARFGQHQWGWGRVKLSMWHFFCQPPFAPNKTWKNRKFRDTKISSATDKIQPFRTDTRLSKHIVYLCIWLGQRTVRWVLILDVIKTK